MQWGNLAIVSVLGVVLSLLLIAHPVFTGMSLVFITALAFIFTGFAAIVLSFQLKKLKSIPHKISQDLKDKIEDLKEEYYKKINDIKD